MGFGISSTWNTPNWGMWCPPTFNNLNTFNFSNNIWPTPSSSGSSTTSTENKKSSNNAELNTIKEDKLKELKITETLEKAKAEKAQLEKVKNPTVLHPQELLIKNKDFGGKSDVGFLMRELQSQISENNSFVQIKMANGIGRNVLEM